MHSLSGGCHCGNLEVTIELSAPSGTFSPRACDCDFCVKHGAAYISDPKGSLRIRIKDKDQVSIYRQGSGTAEFLICRNCGVLVSVIYQSEGRVFGTVNVSALDRTAHFGERTVVSPKVLPANEKTERWKNLWFGQVTLEYNAQGIGWVKANATDA